VESRLKYRLEVQGRPASDVVVSVPFRGWSPGGFSVILSSCPASLVDTLPLMGVTWRGYVAPCTYGS
jgi:hypothetical protein